MKNIERIFPGWKIKEPPIGRGSFGEVYEIEKKESWGEVARAALKVISIPNSEIETNGYRDDGYDDESITEIYKSQAEEIGREFGLMSRLKGNSHIVSYEDHCIIQHDNDPGLDILIRMELLTSLPKYYMANYNGKRIDDQTVIKVGIDICKALELCEKAEIIHRDIKPQNIFVNEYGDFKLGDFGVARVSDHTTKASKAGTYEYMAPEVYFGKRYGAKVDQYSLGMVLYWMLNERRGAFLPCPEEKAPTAKQRSEAEQRRMSGEALLPPVNGSEKLKEIVLKACDAEAENRFGSPKEMRKALEELFDDNWRAGIVPLGKQEAEHSREAEKPVYVGAETIGKYTRPHIKVVQMFHVVFKDEDGKVLSKAEYEEGEALLIPMLPATKIDENNEYKFVGWKPELKSEYAVKDETYTAVYIKKEHEKPKKKTWVAGAIAAVALLGVMLGVMLISLRHINGWGIKNGSAYYYFQNGKAQTGWHTIDGNDYYFDSAGVMQTGWHTIDGNDYYFDSAGVMQTGWQTINGGRYYFDNEGVMQTGWQTINGDRYYFDNEGVMQTGRQTIDGRSYRFDRTGKLISGATSFSVNNGWDSAGRNSKYNTVTGWDEDGNAVWEYESRYDQPLEAVGFSYIGINDGKAYFNEWDTVVVLNLSDGSPVWTWKGTYFLINGAADFDENGNLYLADRGEYDQKSTLIILDKNGKLINQIELDHDLYRPILLKYNGGYNQIEIVFERTRDSTSPNNPVLYMNLQDFSTYRSDQ